MIFLSQKRKKMSNKIETQGKANLNFIFEMPKEIK